MIRAAAMLLALLPAAAAHAEDVVGWANGGIGIAFREPSDDKPFDQLKLEYDDGTVLHVEVGNRYPYGLMTRVDYAYTLYDALTAGGLTILKDIERHEARAAAFYAPWTREPVQWRIGGGFIYMREDIDHPEVENQQDGGFVEAGLMIRSGKRVSFDVAGLGLKVEGKGDYDAEGAEVRLGATFHLRPLDVLLGARYQSLQRETPPDEELIELRLGIGAAWGFPENNPGTDH